MTTKKTIQNRFILAAAIAFLSAFSPITYAFSREKINIDLGWKFIRAEVEGAEASGFDDSEWQTVDLPHDAAIYGPFEETGNGASARVGYRQLGKGWYRKHIQADSSWKGRRVIVEFEGVFRESRVYVNGTPCGGVHKNGFIDFEIDITDLLVDGDNIIAVSYDNTYTKSTRWYNGEGINRHVWLHVLDPLHVDRYGTYITTPKISEEKAKIRVETSVKNEFEDSVLCKLVTEISSPDGKIVGKAQAVSPFSSKEIFQFLQTIYIEDPELWNVGSPKLYKATSYIYRDSVPYDGSKSVSPAFGTEPNDVYETTFGIREIELSPDSGLIVNGKRVYVNGVCLHTDLGPLGTASMDAAWDRRLSAVTKLLGCNGLRLSHNAYPKYVLDWADRNGILIVDEFFDKWGDDYYGKGTKMGEQYVDGLRTQMARDRNHPSIFVWSVGNEVYQQIQKDKTNSGGVEMLKMLVDEARRMDSSRPVTVSQYPNRYGSATKKNNASKFQMAEPHQFEFYTDVVSTNYLENFWDKDREKYPQLVFMAGELAVGDLGYDYFNYDKSYPIGQFYWGGTDYIGESFGWPAKGWVRGLIDITNKLKPLGQSVKSFYTSEPMVKLVTRPSKGQGSLVWNDLKMTWIALEENWNYSEGDTLKVQVMSNCTETELFLNGKSLGKKRLPPSNQPPELVWEVLYEDGELKAIGYNEGIKVAEDVIVTPGKPSRIIAKADSVKIKADGLDLAYIDYEIVDKNGNRCADDVELSFEISGQGTLAGVANGNMLSDEEWKADSRTTYNGLCQLIVRSKNEPGQIKVKAKAKGLKPVTTLIEVAE